jgi:hypothetical protein
MFNPSSAPKYNPNLKVVPDSDEPEKQPNTGFYLFLLLLAIGGIFGTYHLISGSKKSPVIIDQDGNKVLAPHRQKKLDKELKEIDNAAQYVLVADKTGYFPCYTCPDGSGLIYLYKGEVWKYGMTRKGENGRYPKQNYGAPNLRFLIQFQGTVSECLKMEKIKIYSYPLLPEAEKRDFTLIIPPGNVIDS